MRRSYSPPVPPPGFSFSTSLDERLAFLRTVAAIGGCAPLLEVDALRILPADAESFVPGLVDAGLLEHDAERELVRLTLEGLRRITPAQPPR
jgi:hypothetical protein